MAATEDEIEARIICPRCQKVNIPSARFCSQCRYELNPNVQQTNGANNMQNVGNASAFVDPQAPTQPFPAQPAPQQNAQQSPPQTNVEDSTPPVANAAPPAPSANTTPEPPPVVPPPIVMTQEEMQQKLQELQNDIANIDHYFPGDLPDKQAKLQDWERQIKRAQACLQLFDERLLQQTPLDLSLANAALSEAVKVLDFKSQYTVKLIGASGKGKSTLLNTLIGRDVLPTGSGSAVTAVRTSIRLCAKNDPNTEKLKITFLSRKAFTKLLDDTEAEMQKEKAQQQAQQPQQPNNGSTQAEQSKEGPFTQEWQRLVFLRDTKIPKTEKTTGKTYVETYLRDEAHTEEFAVDKGKEFIQESEVQNPPHLTRLVESAEFLLKVSDDSLLPEGSVWVDLPGSSAGRIAHDTILQDELRQLDAVILVASGPRYDDSPTKDIFTKVRDSVWGKRPITSKVDAEKVFALATRWDNHFTPNFTSEQKAANVQSAITAMNALINIFPSGYQKHHQISLDGDEKKKVAFYPLSVLEAIESAKQLKAATTDTARQEANTKLESSGLPALKRDLKNFLAEQRYTTQLAHAKEQLERAFQYLEDACVGYVRQQGYKGQDAQELEDEVNERAKDVEDARFHRLDRLIGEMVARWQMSINEYDSASSVEQAQNSLYKTLNGIYNEALRYMELRIDTGSYDSYITLGGDAAIRAKRQEGEMAQSIYPEESFVEIRRQDLRDVLRGDLGDVLEQLVQQTPATELTRMFPLSVVQRNSENGLFNLSFPSIKEHDKLKNLQQQYSMLLKDLRNVARQICRYVLITEYMSKARILAENHPRMQELAQIKGNVQGQSVIDQARAVMKRIVRDLSHGIAESTYQRAAFLYRKELAKLDRIVVYNTAAPDASSTAEDGKFQELVGRLHRVLNSLAMQEPTFQQELDAQTQSAIDITTWIDLINKIRSARTAQY